MGTYAWFTAGTTALLAVVLWWGPCTPSPRAQVGLDGQAGWIGATLDDGTRIWELRVGELLELPPATYRVTLFDQQGHARSETLEFADRTVQLGGPLSAGDEAVR